VDACHILLDRAWMSNEKVMYNGYLNTNTCSKDEKKITLDAPMQDHEGQSHKMTKLKDVQDDPKIVRNKLEARGSYFPVLPSKHFAFLTLVSQLNRNLNSSCCLVILVLKVSFQIK